MSAHHTDDINSLFPANSVLYVVQLRHAVMQLYVSQFEDDDGVTVHMVAPRLNKKKSIIYTIGEMTMEEENMMRLKFLMECFGAIGGALMFTKVFMAENIEIYQEIDDDDIQ